jgi:hypothetical protein
MRQNLSARRRVASSQGVIKTAEPELPRPEVASSTESGTVAQDIAESVLISAIIFGAEQLIQDDDQVRYRAPSCSIATRPAALTKFPDA